MVRITVIALTLSVLAGCSQNTGRVRQPGANREMPGVTVPAAFKAARTALPDPYRIEHSDVVNHEFRTAPVYYRGRESTGRLSDRAPGEDGGYRKIAFVRVFPGETGQTIVSVRVEIQRNDTVARQAFAYQRKSSDLPSDTPTDAYTAPTDDRRVVWTFIRRDRAEEQKFLKAIAAQAGQKR